MTFCWKVHHCSQITKCIRQVSLVALLNYCYIVLNLLLYSVYSLLHAFIYLSHQEWYLENSLMLEENACERCLAIRSCRNVGSFVVYALECALDGSQLYFSCILSVT